MIMIIVGGINMITALLVLILERTQNDWLAWSVGNATMVNTESLFVQRWLSDWNWVVLGEFIGSWPPFPTTPNSLDYLDPTSYYVTTVPIAFDVSMIAAINIGTFVICLLMLLIPSFIISKSHPFERCEECKAHISSANTFLISVLYSTFAA